MLYRAHPSADGAEIWYGYHYIGEKVTNNVAEYTGLIEGLKQAVEMNVSRILIQGRVRERCICVIVVLTSKNVISKGSLATS